MQFCATNAAILVYHAGVQIIVQIKGGHSHRCCIQSYDHSQDAVKGSWHFLGVGQAVFWAPSPALLVAKRRDRDFAHASYKSMVNGSRAKTHHSQAVEVIFQWPGNEATLGENPLQMAISKYGSGINYILYSEAAP